MRKYNVFTLIIIVGILFSSCGTENTPVYVLTADADPAEGGSISQSATNAEVGQSIEMTATANEHWVFSGWYGDYTGPQNTISVLMDRDKSVIARFVKRDYPLTVNIEGSGKVAEEVVPGRTTEYQSGTMVRLMATADENWEFLGWSEGSDGIVSEEEEFVVEVDGELVITAHFSEKQYLLTTEIVGSGTIGIKVLSGAQSDRGFLIESEIELTAVPDRGWQFIEWQGHLSGTDGTQKLIMDSHKNVSASFEELAYEIDLKTEGRGMATVSPDKVSYRYGDEVVFEAVPAEGYEFLGWYGCLNNKNPMVTTSIEASVNVTATFSTVEDALVSQFSEGGVVNGEVEQAKLSLINRLPESIVLRKFSLYDTNGELCTHAEDNYTIRSREQLSYLITFCSTPDEQSFSQYTAEWHVTYKGVDYMKESKVGFKTTNAKVVSGEEETLLRTLHVGDSEDL